MGEMTRHAMAWEYRVTVFRVTEKNREWFLAEPFEDHPRYGEKEFYEFDTLEELYAWGEEQVSK